METTAAQSSECGVVAPRSDPSADPPRQRFIDGLRGLTALFVVMHHAYAELLYRYRGRGMPPLLWHGLRFLSWGHFAVDIFIVVSGYCLMLPLLRHPGGQLRGGTRGFLLRRARRILPPYYAALLLSLLLIAAVPALRYATSAEWDHPLRAFTPGILLSHVFLIHNLSSAWIYRIDLPLWSIAIECQCYLVFVFALLPVWRRFGTAVTVVVAFALGLAPSLLFGSRVEQACLWYIGLFACGMAAAVAADPARSPGASRPPWGTFALLAFAAILVCGIALGDLPRRTRWLSDPAVGVAVSWLLIACAVDGRSARSISVLRLLEARWAVGLGLFSYSLYLVHYPIIALIQLWLRAARAEPGTILAVSMVMAPALAVLFAYGFYLLFERRFTPAGSRPRPFLQEKRMAVVAGPDPGKSTEASL